MMRHIIGPVYRDEDGNFWRKALVPNPYTFESWEGLESWFWMVVARIHDHLKNGQRL